MTNPPDNVSAKSLYQGFSLPLSGIDCGKKCGPYNDYGVPVCCDIQLLVPTAYALEWCYLQENTDLWLLWVDPGQNGNDLKNQVQDGLVLLACRGYQHCQRDYRTLTCRAFPFFPYLDSKGLFTGLAYYREYREKCWVISNLDLVTQEYKTEFQITFERIFQRYPDSRGNYQGYSQYVREEAALKGDKIILLDFSDDVFLIDPKSEKLHRVDFDDLDSYGPFGIIKELVFPDENDDLVKQK
ncbi:MAG: hypothetical protein MUP11_08940 [Anaerolineales bacterium]|nr:hypothetical protein [Anaerolineales bacterium]